MAPGHLHLAVQPAASAVRAPVQREVWESGLDKAQRLVAEELRKLAWSEEELRKRKKGDAKKLAIARRLRQETTMTLAWVAQRQQMGTKTYLSHLLYWSGRGGRPPAGKGSRS